MKIYTQKPQRTTFNPLRLEQVTNKPAKYVSSSPAKKITIARVIVGLVSVLIPLIVFLYVFPMLLTTASTVLQPFFKAANFTVNGASAGANVKHGATLLKDAEGMTNILIVGVDTRDRGSKLLNTDTIMLATYNPKFNEVSMLSFPRDLEVNYPNTSSVGKINATYAYGEMRQSGSGMDYLRTMIETMSGRKIQYYVMVDLKGFSTIIDQLGGVDVVVDTTFSGLYPTEDYRYMTVKFNKGPAHLNGDLALKFARIRKATPASESLDFSRARRQQKIVKAVIEKATKVETLQNPKTIIDILGSVAANLKINRVSIEDITAGMTILKDKGMPQTFSYVLDWNAGGLNRLITYPGLQSAAGLKNWSQVQSFVKEYVHAPALVSNKPIICVFNAGKADYAKQVAAIKNRFYFTTVKDCGTYNPTVPTGSTAAGGGGVYNVGGAAYVGSANYLAEQYGVKFVEASDASVQAPRGKDSPISIVLQ